MPEQKFCATDNIFVTSSSEVLPSHCQYNTLHVAYEVPKDLLEEFLVTLPDDRPKPA